MIIEILVALFLGVLAGTFTGLSPGIHINLIASILLATSTLISTISPIVLVVFIVSMAITHTFLDFIPSVLFGAPEEDNFLSILPGHEMLKKGKGYEAIVFTFYGSLFALPIILFFTPIFIYLLPYIYPLIKNLIPFVLIFVSCYSLLREKLFFSSLVVFLSSGLLGYLTLNLPVKEPLLPLLTGLFGLSSLMISISQEHSIPTQKIYPLTKIKLSKKEFLNSSIISFVAPFCSFLPGIGSGHAAFISSEILPQSKRGFLFLNGAANTIIMALSFLTLFSINRTRSGAAVAVQKLLNTLTPYNLIIILSTIILSSIISFFFGIYLSKKAVFLVNKIRYKTLSIIVIFLLLIINFVFSNFLGLIVLLTSTFIGIFCILSGSKRINLMGALIIPVVLYYLSN